MNMEINRIELIVNGEKEIVMSDRDLEKLEDLLFLVLEYAKEYKFSYLSERVDKEIEKIRKLRGL